MKQYWNFYNMTAMKIVLRRKSQWIPEKKWKKSRVNRVIFVVVCICSFGILLFY